MVALHVVEDLYNVEEVFTLRGHLGWFGNILGMRVLQR